MNILNSTQVNWLDYKNLRLKALKEEPQSFGSSYEDHKDNTDSEWQQRLEEYKQGKKAWMFFAEKSGKLIGMVGGWQEETDIQQGIVNIMGMYVVPEYRGKGISKLLLHTLLEELKKNTSIKKVTLTVNTSKTSAFNLYKNLGFVEIEKKMEKMGDGVEYEVVEMEKKLH